MQLDSDSSSTDSTPPGVQQGHAMCGSSLRCADLLVDACKDAFLRWAHWESLQAFGHRPSGSNFWQAVHFSRELSLHDSTRVACDRSPPHAWHTSRALQAALEMHVAHPPTMSSNTAHCAFIACTIRQLIMYCRQPTSSRKKPGRLVSQPHAQRILSCPHGFSRSSGRPSRAGALSSQPRPGAQAGARGCTELDLLAAHPSPGEASPRCGAL